MRRLLAILLCLAGAQLTWAAPPQKLPEGVAAEFYRNAPGEDLAGARAAIAAGKPAQRVLLPTFQYDNRGEHYAARLEAIFTPPADGDYRFLISADDTAELTLSEDGAQAPLRVVAGVPSWTEPGQFDRHAQQRSDPIKLRAGQGYRLRAIHKNGGGPGHLTVAWILPDGTRQSPIPARHLRAPEALPPPKPLSVSIDRQLAHPQTPGFHKFRSAARFEGEADSFTMSYVVYLPTNYRTEGERFGLIVFLHGNTHQGVDMVGVLNEGPGDYLTVRRELRRDFPMILLLPQLPPGMRWDSPNADKAVPLLVDALIGKYHADPDRVYLSGLSMGGKGTWLAALADPRRFAAIAPICSVSVRPDEAVERLGKLPTWIIVGEHDGGYTDGSRQMHKALLAAGAPAHLTVVPREGHGVWARYYSDIDFYRRLLRHKRGDATANFAP